MNVDETDTLVNLGGDLLSIVCHCVGSTLAHSGGGKLIVGVVSGKGSPVLGDVGVVEDVEVDVGGEEGCECVGQSVGLARGRCGMQESEV